MPTIETRKSAKGITYRAKVRLDGHPTATKTFTRLAAAKAWAIDTESRMRNGLYAAGSGRTLAEAIDAFLGAELGERKDQRMLAARLGWWRETLGSTHLRDLSPALIADRLNVLERTPQPPRKRNGRPRARSPATINRYRAAVSAALTWAESQSPPWINGNPARRTKHRPEFSGRIRFLDREEREALLRESKRSASPDLHLAVVLSLSTGARQGEILGLRWRDINFSRAIMVFRDTKNGDTRAVPIPSQALALLQQRCGNGIPADALVFPSRNNSARPINLRSGFTAVVRRAGIRDFRWHDQRHSAASAFADLGASLLDIGTILGHRSQQTTRRYSHLTESRLRELIEVSAQKHGIA